MLSLVRSFGCFLGWRELPLIVVERKWTNRKCIAARGVNEIDRITDNLSVKIGIAADKPNCVEEA